MTAFQAEGCGIALRAMLIKSELRDWLSMSYGMKSILRIGSLRSPPPIRFRRTSPCSGGRINRSMLSCRDMAPWLSIHSPTTKWWHQRRKRISSDEARLACFSPGESPVVRFYHKRAPSINVRRPPQPSAAEPLSNLRTLGAIAPSNFRTLNPQRGLSISRQRAGILERIKLPVFSFSCTISL